MDVDTVYNQLVERVFRHGKHKDDRTGTGTISKFGEHIEIDISTNAALLTSKKVSWKSCIYELLWFLNGFTNSQILEQNKVNIWKANSSREFLDKQNLRHYEEGDCGPIYGFQWNYFGKDYYPYGTVQRSNIFQGVDQIAYIDKLLKTDPDSRRMYMSAWNPVDLPKMALPPCHVSSQFYVQDNKLSCHVYQRSCDIFLGLPWNIFSYDVLTSIFAKRNGMELDKLIFSFGDCHIYNNHVEQLKEQISREKKTQKPTLNILENMIDMYRYDISCFEVINYDPHPAIKGQMSV